MEGGLGLESRAEKTSIVVCMNTYVPLMEMGT